jgi:nucleoside-diphosphate-sugar epimerase
MRYLVTGGSGFVGRYLCERLAERGDAITILDLQPPAADAPPCRFVRGDVRDPAAVREALAGCDAVFHLAAAHHDVGIVRETYFAVNEGAARTLCAAMDEAGIADVCFYSSAAVYGAAPEPHDEDGPTDPVNPYGASKLAGEVVFRAWAALGGGRRALVVRPTITFGPRNFANMSSLIRQIHGGKFLPVGAGTNVKSLSYVENLVDATLFLWDLPDRPAFDVYNWVEKPDMTSREIADAIYAALGRRAPGFSVPLPLALALALPFDAVIRLTGRNLPISSMRVRKLAGDQTRFEADKVRAAGFTPRVDLAEGIARMVRWYVAEGRLRRAEWHIPPAAVQPLHASSLSSPAPL